MGWGGNRADTNPQRLPEIGDIVWSKFRVGMGADDWASGDNPGVPMAGESEGNPFISSPVCTGWDGTTRSS